MQNVLLIKPNALQQRFGNIIINEVIKAGYSINDAKFLMFSQDEAKKFYNASYIAHQEKYGIEQANEILERNSKFMSSGMSMYLEIGLQSTALKEKEFIEHCRGFTNYLRTTYGQTNETYKQAPNSVHMSDSIDSQILDRQNISSVLLEQDKLMSKSKIITDDIYDLDYLKQLSVDIDKSMKHGIIKSSDTLAKYLSSMNVLVKDMISAPNEQTIVKDGNLLALMIDRMSPARDSYIRTDKYSFTKEGIAESMYQNKHELNKIVGVRDQPIVSVRMKLNHIRSVLKSDVQAFLEKEKPGLTLPQKIGKYQKLDKSDMDIS